MKVNEQEALPYKVTAARSCGVGVGWGEKPESFI